MKILSHPSGPTASLRSLPAARQVAPPAPLPAEEPKVENTVNLSPKAIKRLLWGGAAATTVGLGWMGYNIGQQLMSAGSVGAWAAAAGCAVGGFLAADLASGLVHHGLDNYATKDTKLIGYIAQDFQAHHHDAKNILKSEKVGLLFPWAQTMPVGLLALGALNPHYTVASAVFAAASGMAFCQVSHQLSHDPKPGPVTKALRKLHLAVESDDHLAHHRKPWASNYCFLNGVWNPLLDKTHFWRKWEKAVFQVTGAEPKVWNHPAVRAKALENISDQEYSARLKSEMGIFKQNIDFERERRESLEFMNPGSTDPGAQATHKIEENTHP